MAASQEQKVDFLLKKIGYVQSKTGIAEDASGISGTKMRAHASNNDYKSFKSGLHQNTSHGEAKKLFSATRKGMGLKENQRRLSFAAFLGEGNARD